jgi:Ser/Thr protein kinase RdoA (MazF antagonist)
MTLRIIAEQFEMPGEFVTAAPYGTGHINDTYCAVFNQTGAQIRYILQRVNHKVFKNPVVLMENIQRVTTHLGAKYDPRDPSNRTLTLIPSREGRSWHRDAEENYWRAYRFIEKARAYDAVETPAQAYEAARAFGRFQKSLADLPPPRLHDTIPDFHHTPKRFARLEGAIAADPANRAKAAAAEIDFALRHKPITTILLDAGLPERVTHNDTKINNVMLDDATGAGVCVIDLDTVMPGLALYDFGDLVRTASSPTKEDERDLSKVGMSFPLFEALLRGYLSSASDFLTAREKEHLAVAGKLITFEIGVRFLTDHLEGDAYFKVHRAGHNLDRARAQFKLVDSISRQEEAMNKLALSLP